tara:strand:- start:1273 stop:1386 length:114 start_codon:yes stop_codon:yes gene_type:complete
MFSNKDAVLNVRANIHNNFFVKFMDMKKYKVEIINEK